MKNTFLFFARHYLFWWIVFLFFRMVFLFSVSSLLHGTSFIELLQSLFAGYQLDWSTASYFAVVPFMIAIISIAGGSIILNRITNWYYLIMIVLVVVLSVSNIIVFKYWGTLLNNRGLAFAAQPAEMLASVSTVQSLFILSILLVLIFAVRFLYRKMVKTAFENFNGTKMQRILALLVILPFIGIGIRGGLQLIPVNESNASFSSHRILNQAAINNIWYLGHNLKQSGIKSHNPYVKFPDKEAADITHALLNKSDSSHMKILDIGKAPNVVIILLESWTADIIEPLGGVKGVTPEFSRLCSEGLLFTSIYSSGFRTDQALVSVLSGFPSQPNKSIIRFPDKTTQLPSVAMELKKRGYKTSFYYGGELGFANMNTYLRSSGFDQIISIDDFKSSDLNSKWGAHDQFVFDRQLNDLSDESQPFLSTLLTLSTHEPFEVPMNTPFNGTSEPELFKKSAWYTDQCLKQYFTEVQKSGWYKNTIFILMADHGHRLPLNRDYFDPRLRKIPVLVWSPLLKPELKGTTLSILGSQHDIAATLLAELGIQHDAFEWSNDLLKPGRTNFAYLSLDNALTWLHDTTVTIIPLEQGLPGSNAGDSTLRPAQAYLQHLYSTFLAY